MTECYIADANPQNISETPTDGGCVRSDSRFLLIIFSILITRSARGITPMIQKRLGKFREI